MSVDHAAFREAAESFPVLRDDTAGDADYRRWREWLDASARHCESGIRRRRRRPPGRQAQTGMALERHAESPRARRARTGKASSPIGGLFNRIREWRTETRLLFLVAGHLR